MRHDPSGPFDCLRQAFARELQVRFFSGEIDDLILSDLFFSWLYRERF